MSFVSESINAPYEAQGYASREHYLEEIANGYGVDLDVVISMADVLGPDEDFDGLISMIMDFVDVI